VTDGELDAAYRGNRQGLNGNFEETDDHQRHRHERRGYDDDVSSGLGGAGAKGPRGPVRERMITAGEFLRVAA
jgi:hypothetical protein